MSKIPQPLSPGEELLALHLKAYGITAEREYVFAEGRKYRFDFALPDRKVAVEVDGGTRQGGRHNRHSGYEADCRKLNLAASLSWAVYRFTTEMVKSGEAVDFIRKVLE